MQSKDNRITKTFLNQAAHIFERYKLKINKKSSRLLKITTQNEKDISLLKISKKITEDASDELIGSFSGYFWWLSNEDDLATHLGSEMYMNMIDDLVSISEELDGEQLEIDL